MRHRAQYQTNDQFSGRCVTQGEAAPPTHAYLVVPTSTPRPTALNPSSGPGAPLVGSARPVDQGHWVVKGQWAVQAGSKSKKKTKRLALFDPPKGGAHVLTFFNPQPPPPKKWVLAGGGGGLGGPNQKPATAPYSVANRMVYPFIVATMIWCRQLPTAIHAGVMPPPTSPLRMHGLRRRFRLWPPFLRSGV